MESPDYDPQLATDFSANLDKALPVELYQPSSLDLSLWEEAKMMADVRINDVLEYLDGNDISGNLNRSFKGDAYYAEHYPGHNHRTDMRLYDEDKPSWSTLFNYGSEAARGEITVQFLGQYSLTFRNAWQFCQDQNLSVASGEAYLQAMLDFTKDLVAIRHVSEDELMRPALLTAGAKVAQALGLPRNTNQAWTERLRKDIGTYDFLGEDGTVMEDTTYCMVGYVNDWFSAQLHALEDKEENGQLTLDLTE